ncbi:MAG: hypothetical protein LBR49_00200 [Tannerella sp.]|nr:hypothetical protein [Tannerella sp.]
MKKYFLLAGLLVFMLASCEGPAGPMGPAGEPGEGMNWKIVTYVVHESDWQLIGQPDALESYFMYEFNENSLSNFIYTDGNVFGYRILDAGLNSEVLTPLPHVVPHGEVLSNGSESLWTEIYSFDYMPGSIAFYVHYSDFMTGLRPPTCDFRIVMNW